MPAINLSRLKTQAENLADHFGQPDDFIRMLHETLDSYTNRTIRVSQKALRTSLPSYETPHPVLRQMEITLSPLASSRPADAVKLVEALWGTGYYEVRLLAANIMGRIPPESALSLYSKMPDWMSQTSDRDIQQALLTDALANLRTHNLDAFLALLESWLKDSRHKNQIWGLQALTPLLQSVDFENLPAVFRILRPVIENASPATQIDLQSCLIALEDISLVETAHYLREIIDSNPSPQALRTLRRILPSLSPAMQAEIRDILRSSL
jgi:hypothetical protein